MLSEETTHTLNQFVYRVSLPAAILSAFWGIDWSKPEVLQILLLNIVILIPFGIGILLLGMLFKLSAEMKAALFMGALVGNTVYMGFPIGQGAFGAEGFDFFLAAAMPHIALGIIFAELVAERLTKRKRKLSIYAKESLRNPLVITFFGGILLSLFVTGDGVILELRRAVGLIAATASPLALIGIGAFLYRRLAPLKSGVEFAIIAIKIIVFPVLMLAIGMFFPQIGKDVIAASAVAASMPVAISVFIITERHKVAPAIAANTILWSTLISIVTINVFLAFIL